MNSNNHTHKISHVSYNYLGSVKSRWCNNNPISHSYQMYLKWTHPVVISFLQQIKMSRNYNPMDRFSKRQNERNLWFRTFSILYNMILMILYVILKPRINFQTQAELWPSVYSHLASFSMQTWLELRFFLQDKT